MTVHLRGNSPVALTTGILLLSRARSFGQPIDVVILGDPATISSVRGPAIFHSPVPAGCGVGRDLGVGSLVVIGGAHTDPLAVSLHPDGLDDWFYVDRAGAGQCAATAAFIRLCRAPDRAQRDLGRQLQALLASLGCPSEPALLDLLFDAPAPPLTRLSLALRAGRAMTGERPPPIVQHLAPCLGMLPDPLPAGLAAHEFGKLLESDSLRIYLDRLSVRVQHVVELWAEGMCKLVLPSDPDMAALLIGLAEILSHLTSLPAQGMLPPLPPALDAVAVGLESSLGAPDKDSNANAQLVDIFRFLGGRFEEEHPHAIRLDGTAAPEGHLDRLAWFCQQSRQAADQIDSLWRDVADPVQ